MRKINQRLGYQPLRTVWAACGTAVVLGLLSLINNAAANALFSLAAAGNNVAWAIPILCRVVWGRDKFRPGPFYTGKFSVPIAITAVVYLAFATTLCMFPTEGPNPDRKSQSYTIFDYRSNRNFSLRNELFSHSQRISLGRSITLLLRRCVQVVQRSKGYSSRGLDRVFMDHTQQFSYRSSVCI